MEVISFSSSNKIERLVKNIKKEKFWSAKIDKTGRIIGASKNSLSKREAMKKGLGSGNCDYLNAHVTPTKVKEMTNNELEQELELKGIHVFSHEGELDEMVRYDPT